MDSLIFPVADVYVGGSLIGLVIFIILVVIVLRLLGVL